MRLAARRASHRPAPFLALAAAATIAATAAACHDADGPSPFGDYHLVRVNDGPLPATVETGDLPAVFTSGEARFTGDTVRLTARFTRNSRTDSLTMRERYTISNGQVTIWWSVGGEPTPAGTLGARDAVVNLAVSFASTNPADTLGIAPIVPLKLAFHR